MAQRILGLDIGARAVKAVLLEGSYRGFAVADFGEVPLAPASEGGPTLRERQAAALAALLAEKRWTVDACVAVTPGASVAAHLVSLPFTDPRRIEQTVPFEVEAQIPYELAEAAWDWQSLGERGGGTDLWVGVAPRTEVAGLLELLAGAGLDPRSVVPAAPALAALFGGGAAGGPAPALWGGGAGRGAPRPGGLAHPALPRHRRAARGGAHPGAGGRRPGRHAGRRARDPRGRRRQPAGRRGRPGPLPARAGRLGGRSAHRPRPGRGAGPAGPRAAGHPAGLADPRRPAPGGPPRAVRRPGPPPRPAGAPGPRDRGPGGAAPAHRDGRRSDPGRAGPRAGAGPGGGAARPPGQPGRAAQPAARRALLHPRLRAPARQGLRPGGRRGPGAPAGRRLHRGQGLRALAPRGGHRQGALRRPDPHPRQVLRQHRGGHLGAARPRGAGRLHPQGLGRRGAGRAGGAGPRRRAAPPRPHRHHRQEAPPAGDHRLGGERRQDRGRPARLALLRRRPLPERAQAERRRQVRVRRGRHARLRRAGGGGE